MFRTLRQTDLIELQENVVVYYFFQLPCRGRVVRLELFSRAVTWEGAAGDIP